MVRNNHVAFILMVCLLLMLVRTARTWTGSYGIDSEGAKIWINQDGSVDSSTT